MSDNLKSGHELIGEFFSAISILETPDKELVKTIIELYKENKLSNINLTNELDRLKDKKLHDKN